jgi:hypothetical protein
MLNVANFPEKKQTKKKKATANKSGVSMARIFC